MWMPDGSQAAARRLTTLAIWRRESRVQKGWRRSLLSRGAKSQDAALVELLLSHGADPESKNRFGVSIFDVAEDDEELLKLLKSNKRP